jgi:hypothetical protein
MYIPQGYTEQQIIDSIIDVVKTIAHSFTFGCYELEDIKQEGFIFGMEALPKFNNTKGASLKSFLHTHIKYRLINLRRDKLHGNFPCSRCEEFVGGDCQLEQPCKKWHSWSFRVLSRQRLMETYDIESTTQYYIDDPLQVLCDKELLQYISDNIDLRLRADYKRFLEDAKLPKGRRDKVVEAAKQLTDEFYEGGANGKKEG